MSVPQFGGWDQKAPGATNYSMVFTQARANKKHQKTNLTEIKRKSLGNEGDFVKANHGHAHHHHVRGHAHEDPVVMGKKKILTYINCCTRP
ncbi:Pathogenic type III effector avirulence factor Avr cleavage site [Spatholobus suberectus]|nr:Pathogenic type III effector avirulence factor Avr cleavage site [Spatholobus suberectus]